MIPGVHVSVTRTVCKGLETDAGSIIARRNLKIKDTLRSVIAGRIQAKDKREPFRSSGLFPGWDFFCGRPYAAAIHTAETIRVIFR